MMETQQIIKKSPKKGIRETDVNLILEISRGIQENLKAEYITLLIQNNALSDRSVKTLLKKSIKSKANHSDKIKIIEQLLMKLPIEKTNILTETLNDQSSLLIKLLSYGEIKILEILNRLNINFAEVKDGLKKNLLFYTVEQPEMIKLLINAGVNIDDIEEGERNTALTYAASKNYKASVMILIERGANVNHVNSYGNSALFYSVKFSQLDIIKLIISIPNSELNLENKENLNPISLALNMNLTSIYQMLAEEFYRRKTIANNDNSYKQSFNINPQNKIKSVNDLENTKFKIENQLAFSFKKEDKIPYRRTSPITVQNNLNVNGKLLVNNPTNSNKNYSNSNQIINNYIHNQYAGQNLIISSNGTQVLNNIPKNQHSNLTIEIPFSFKDKQKNGKKNVSDFIKFQDPPILKLDISTDLKQKQLIASCNGDDYEKITNERLLKVEAEKDKLLEEIHLLKLEITKDKEELALKERKFFVICDEIKIKDEIIKKTINENQTLIEKNSILISLNEKLEKENKELKNKKDECLSSKTLNKVDLKCLERKFSTVKYEDKYSAKCLYKDLIDFQELTKENIKKLKTRQEELIKLIQESIKESIVDFEIIVYGSHATQLCLPWSDIDLVLVPSKSSVNFYSPLHKLFYNIQEKAWKKVAKLIDNTAIPVLKITSNDQFNIQIDISVQDSRHYGIKCVELVKSFLKEYEVLEHLVLALKNILKQANLNDPYTVIYIYIGRFKLIRLDSDDSVIFAGKKFQLN